MTSLKVISQAQMISARLPGKALLPVGGLPLVFRCAKRAARTGLPLTVATSSEEGDDLLCDTWQSDNIAYIRGPLDNLLGCSLLATEDMGLNETREAI